MPHEISWLEDKRVVFERIYGVVTLADARIIQEEFSEFAKSGTPPIHLLIDMTELTDYPKNILEMKNYLNINVNDGLGWVIFVTHNKILRFITSMMTQLLIHQARLRMFDTIDEALKFLQEYDVTLPKLQNPLERQ